MISKSRLEELIEQEKQVWKIYKDTCQGAYQVPAGLFGIGFSSQVDKTTPFNELFETKEEAEWYREFGCIERAERLELPTWEEFNNRHTIKFYNNLLIFYLYIAENNFNNYEKIIRISKDEYIDNVVYVKKEHNIIFEQPLTKENYTLACRKAKELFLGEKE